MSHKEWRGKALAWLTSTTGIPEWIRSPQLQRDGGWKRKCGAASVGEYNRVIQHYQLS